MDIAEILRLDADDSGIASADGAMVSDGTEICKSFQNYQRGYGSPDWIAILGIIIAVLNGSLSNNQDEYLVNGNGMYRRLILRRYMPMESSMRLCGAATPRPVHCDDIVARVLVPDDLLP